MKVKSLSRVQLLATPWTAAHQAPPAAVPCPWDFPGNKMLNHLPGPICIALSGISILLFIIKIMLFH